MKKEKDKGKRQGSYFAEKEVFFFLIFFFLSQARCSFRG